MRSHPVTPFAKHLLAAAVIFCALQLPALAQTSASAANDKLVDHTAVQGDSIISIAKRLLEEPTRWREIMGFNKSVINPNMIQPGQTIKIPEHLLKMDQATATVAFVAGRATSAGKTLEKGANLSAGQDVSTGKDSVVTLNLQDGSKVLVQAETELILSELKFQNVSGGRKQLFDLKKGRVEILAQPAKTASSRFEVRTPSSIAGVRGTVFRVASDVGNSKTEVLEGTVAASVSSQQVAVSGGFGTRIDSGQAPRAPRALLAAPAAPTLTRLGNPNQAVVFSAVPGAAAYRVLIARDAAFSDVVRVRVEAKPNIDFSGLVAGSYFVRARALDELGLEGLNRDSTITLKIELPAPDLSKAPLPDATFESNTRTARVQLNWPQVTGATQYQIEVADNASFNNAKTVVANVNNVVLPISFTASGTYYWRVRSGDGLDFGPASQSAMFTLTDAAPLMK